jgi:hypothetical protein
MNISSNIYYIVFKGTYKELEKIKNIIINKSLFKKAFSPFDNMMFNHLVFNINQYDNLGTYRYHTVWTLLKEDDFFEESDKVFICKNINIFLNHIKCEKIIIDFL